MNTTFISWGQGNGKASYAANFVQIEILLFAQLQFPQSYSPIFTYHWALSPLTLSFTKRHLY